MLSTTLRFAPSPDDTLTFGEYEAIVFIEGARQPNVKIPRETRSLTVDAMPGQAVQVFVSYRNAAGVNSQGREFRFRARDDAPPAPPGEIVIEKVYRKCKLPVLS